VVLFGVVLALGAVHGFTPVIAGGVVLVLKCAAGHAVGLAGLCHALAGGDLAGLVLSHDRQLPGEAARVCSPWWTACCYAVRLLREVGSLLAMTGGAPES
jgi:hypothetical protein